MVNESWFHEMMVSGRMMFGEVVAKIGRTRSPVY